MKEIQHRCSMRWEGRKAGEIKDPKERDIQLRSQATKSPQNNQESQAIPQAQAMEKRPKTRNLPGRRLCGPWIMARWLRSFESQYYSWNLVQHGRSHCRLGRKGGWVWRFSRFWRGRDPVFFFRMEHRPPRFFSGRCASSKDFHFGHWPLQFVFFMVTNSESKNGPQWSWFFTNGHLLDM